MVEPVDRAFAGAIPDVYDEYLVPMIFQMYADDLAGRVSTIDPKSVLEVAAGSGVATRSIAAVLGDAARFVVSDLNPPMLERARSMQNDADHIEWRQADCLDLPFEDDSFDAVVCQFGAMFFPDRVRAYSEVMRVLHRGGVFIFSMWDRIEENDFAFEVTSALANLFPDDPPNFLPRTPHGHYREDEHRRELSTAGFTNVTVEAVDGISRASGPSFAAIAYCHGTPLRSEIEALDPAGVDVATAHAATAIAARFGVGEVEGRIRGFVITAR
ncbi:MAG: class I SAM-dependent methyltransferase [Acidimicrobiia bacterium]